MCTGQEKFPYKQIIVEQLLESSGVRILRVWWMSTLLVLPFHLHIKKFPVNKTTLVASMVIFFLGQAD